MHGFNDFAQELIKRGVRAQLDMQSIVTGQLMVSLDFYPDKPATLVGADPRYVGDPHDSDDRCRNWQNGCRSSP